MFQSKNGSGGTRDRDDDPGFVPSIPDANPKSDDLVRHLKPRYERSQSPAVPQAAPSLGASPQPRRHADGVLIIGAGVQVRGTIGSCDELIVEGTVESTIECRSLTVAETGSVKGEATVQELDVHGAFDGKAEVAGCLTIRTTGRVSGTARYGQLEIERGGVISGELGPTSDAAGRKASKSDSAAAAPVAAE